METTIDGGAAVHFVHTIEVEVITTVETVLVVEIIVEVPEVEVSVTGQVVRVVNTTSVVMICCVLSEGAVVGTTDLLGTAATGGELEGLVVEVGPDGRLSFRGVPDGGGELPGGVPEGIGAVDPVHLVQTVEIDVIVVVDTVVVTCVKVLEPDVEVTVTGQVVTISVVTAVVIIPEVRGVAGGEGTAEALDEGGEAGVVLVLDFGGTEGGADVGGLGV